MIVTIPKAVFVKKYMVMWWMLEMVVKFTLQMAFVEYNDTAHGLISKLWLEVRPSTA